MLILVLAANTAYADFPRLASILARDRYLPRQFMNQGDRLAFSNGIVGLSVFAGDPARRVRRRHARVDSALHDRRVRVVHPVAGRHGGSLAAPAWAGVADERAHQRRRRAGDWHRARRRRGDKGGRGRVDHHAADPAARPDLRGDAKALRRRRGAADAARLAVAGAAQRTPCCADQRDSARRRRSAAITRRRCPTTCVRCT